MRRFFSGLALICAIVMFTGIAGAVEPDERLADPALEARARSISAGLRCLICQNQSIDDSSAPLARDLRILVRQRLVAGDTDRDVERFIVSRYGEFALLRPRFNWHTVILWLAPFALLCAVIVALWRRARQRLAASADPQTPLSAREQADLDRILSAAAKSD